MADPVSKKKRPLIVIAFMAMFANPAALADVYVLGSSFSNDARPQFLDDSPQWHIDCGRPLQYIFDNPSSPCLATSTVWPVALTATQFHHISFQPVASADEGITQQSDIDVIGYWMSLQPNVKAVIHPTWPRPAIWESTFHDPDPDNAFTNYSREYYYELIDNLRAANPGRRFVTDRVNEMLDAIYHDIQNAIGPLTDFQQMFRDESGHSSDDYGSYLQHNALRQAFGQQTGIDVSASGLEPEVKAYFDAKIVAYPPLPSDVDWDSVLDEDDNCPAIFNPYQADADADGVGDDCDSCTDTDGDGYGNSGFPANTCEIDNCPGLPNPEQFDGNGDGSGDLCDGLRHLDLRELLRRRGRGR